jgi:hypothetical protein
VRPATCPLSCCNGRLERRLPYTVLARWNVRLYYPSFRIEEAGVQDLSMEFPCVPYAGHLKEAGYNAIFFK